MPGESLAIIGPSGAGKSTLVRLLTGVWKPSAGTVRLDQADLAQWPREELGPWLGYVPQDVELFPGTRGREHRPPGRGRFGTGRARRAAGPRARADPLAAEGYDTMVDPQSALLSPGQRQRIALARALYGDPKLRGPRRTELQPRRRRRAGPGRGAQGAARAASRWSWSRTARTLVQHVDKMLVLEAGQVAALRPDRPRSCRPCSRRCSSPRGRRPWSSRAAARVDACTEQPLDA